MIKKVLVTGAAGFIGSNLCNRLRQIANYDILGIDNMVFGSTYNIDMRTDDNWEFAKIDFDDLGVEALRNHYDVIIHCATSNIIWAQNNPLETFQTNSLKTVNLFKKFKGRVVYLSTSSIYNNANDIPTKETSIPHCVNAYDTSKYIAELYLEERGNYTTLRLNNTYGINQRPDSFFSGVLGKFINSAINDKAMTIYGDGMDTRSYTYVDDVVDAIIKAIEISSLNTEINVGSPEEISTMELCRLVWEMVDKPTQYNIVSPRSIDTIKRRALDCTKAKELLGWEAKTSLEEGVAKTITWQKSL